MAIKTVDVVVNKGKTLFHDGVKTPENTKISLPEDAANRLIQGGYVTLYTDVMAQVTGASAAPSVTVSPAASPATAATASTSTAAS